MGDTWMLRRRDGIEGFVLLQVELWVSGTVVGAWRDTVVRCFVLSCSEAFWCCCTRARELMRWLI